MNRSRRHDQTAAEKLELLNRYIFCRINTEKILHFVHFRKRRLLKPPRIKSKTGCPEVDLLTEFHCNIIICCFGKLEQWIERQFFHFEHLNEAAYFTSPFLE